MAEKKQLAAVVYHTLNALKRNKFHAVFLKDQEEALQFVLDMIPHGTTVGARALMEKPQKPINL